MTGPEGVRVSVPPSLDVAYADELRARGLAVCPDEGLFAALRRTKTRAEVCHIEKVQRAVEEPAPEPSRSSKSPRPGGRTGSSTGEAGR